MKIKYSVLFLTLICFTAYFVYFKDGDKLPDSQALVLAPVNDDGISSTSLTALNHKDNLGKKQPSNNVLEKANSPSTEAKKSIETNIPENVNIDELNHILKANGDSVDGESLVKVMKAKNFSQLVDGLDEGFQKSINTDVYEGNIDRFIIQNDTFKGLDDYKIKCNNSYCLGYFVSSNKVNLDKIIDDLNFSKDTPLLASGFFNSYVFNNENGQELRVSFNSDPNVIAIDQVKAN
jgi:hypothetical protein